MRVNNNSNECGYRLINQLTIHDKENVLTSALRTGRKYEIRQRNMLVTGTNLLEISTAKCMPKMEIINLLYCISSFADPIKTQ